MAVVERVRPVLATCWPRSATPAWPRRAPFGDSHYPDHLAVDRRTAQAARLRHRISREGHYGPEQVGDRGTPPHHGFDTTFYGLAGQQAGRLNYLRHSRAAMEEYGEFGTTVSAVQPMVEGDTEVDCETFLTDELGARARRFVTENMAAGRPLFLMLAFNAVHNFCWQLPPEELERRGLPAHAGYRGERADYRDWYDGQVRPNLDHGREYYLAQLELMDDQIGRLLDTLDELRRTDDTLVVYLTDNGGSNCNFADNTPLRGTIWA